MLRWLSWLKENIIHHTFIIVGTSDLDQFPTGRTVLGQLRSHDKNDYGNEEAGTGMGENGPDVEQVNATGHAEGKEATQAT